MSFQGSNTRQCRRVPVSVGRSRNCKNRHDSPRGKCVRGMQACQRFKDTLIHLVSTGKSSARRVLGYNAHHISCNNNSSAFEQRLSEGHLGSLSYLSRRFWGESLRPLSKSSSLINKLNITTSKQLNMHKNQRIFFDKSSTDDYCIPTQLQLGDKQCIIVYEARHYHSPQDNTQKKQTREARVISRPSPNICPTSVLQVLQP